MMNNSRSNPGFLLVLAGVFAAGAFLRLHSLASQILLDDEWQSVIQVIGRSYVDVLTHFNPRDNCSPLQELYNLALYRSFGWSESTLRLPMILAGLASLILLPLLIRQLFNDRVTVIFSGLLAISPFLIFYSRYARTYEFMMLFGFAALLLFHQWLTTGRRRYATGFACAGIFAVYTHLFSLVAIFAPLILMIGLKAMNRFKPGFSAGRQIVVSGKALSLMTLVLLLALIPVMIPALLQSAQLPWAMGEWTWGGVTTAATLLSGTTNLPLNFLFYPLCILGFRWIFKHNALLGWIFLSAIGGYIIVLAFGRPLGLNIGAILLRYMIVTVPVALTAVALGLDQFLIQSQKITRIHGSLPVLAVGGFMGCLCATGPLLARQMLSNNFNNHSAFQGTYRHLTWERSKANSVYPAYSISQDQVPPFYHWLRSQTNIETVVEYPFDTCDFNDLLYYYQHFHRKQVIAGYCTDPTLIGFEYALPNGDQSRFTIGMLCADAPLSLVAEPKKLKFRNMVDVRNITALLCSNADCIIMHKYIMALKIVPGDAKTASIYSTIRVYYRSVRLLAPRFREIFGPPVYEDEQIICFRLKLPVQMENQPGTTNF